MNASDPQPNRARGFLFEQLDIRGAWVQLSSAWREMTAGRAYAEPVHIAPAPPLSVIHLSDYPGTTVIDHPYRAVKDPGKGQGKGYIPERHVRGVYEHSPPDIYRPRNRQAYTGDRPGFVVFNDTCNKA